MSSQTQTEITPAAGTDATYQPAPFLSRGACLYIDVFAIGVLVSVGAWTAGEAGMVQSVSSTVIEAVTVGILLLIRLWSESRGKLLSTKTWFDVSLVMPGEGWERFARAVLRNAWIVVALIIDVVFCVQGGSDTEGTVFLVAFVVWLTAIFDVEKRTILERWSGTRLVVKVKPADRDGLASSKKDTRQ